MTHPPTTILPVPSAYVERERFILDACRGLRVLHLGCIGMEYCDSQTRARTFERSLHHQLSAIADVTGVDLSAQAIELIRRDGLASNIVVGDVQHLESLGLEATFDRVVAGDIIEHITCPGRMLDGARALLRLGGELIVTTPNAFGLPRYLRFLSGRFRENDEHVMCFNFENLFHMLERHGLTPRRAMTCYQRRARGMGAAFQVGRAILERVPRWGGTLLVTASVKDHTRPGGAGVSPAITPKG